jgi:hypothetical protein
MDHLLISKYYIIICICIYILLYVIPERYTEIDRYRYISFQENNRNDLSAVPIILCATMPVVVGWSPSTARLQFRSSQADDVTRKRGTGAPADPPQSPTPLLYYLALILVYF